MLKTQDTALDLMLRGYDQATVLDRTGVDIGYHGIALRKEAAGVDRFAYKVQHVRERVDPAQITATLESFAGGVTKASVLDQLGLAGENIVTLRKFFAALGLSDEFKAADAKNRKAAMAAGMQEKYGVDNPFKLTEFQEQAEETREQRYGGKYTLSTTSSLAERARETFSEHMEDETFAAEVHNKKIATNLERHGVEHAAQSPEIQQKSREVWLENHGVDHPSKRPEARKAQSERATENGEAWAAKAKQTNLERYGVENVSQLPENRERISAFMKENHANHEKKTRETTRERYGYDYASQRPERRAEMSAFMGENGAEFARRSKETSLERYGVSNWVQTPQGRQAQSERMSNADHQARINAAKRTNGSFNASAPEDDLARMLGEHFGADDVVREYSDSRYPSRSDFYIPSRDLFIELNATWTHGGHWFDADDTRDQQTLAQWASKSSKFYDAAAQNWTVRDVSKREAARAGGLNYVVFWGQRDLADAALWLAMGAPDGKDWDREYSWLPLRELTLDTFPAVLDARPRTIIKAARAANWREFYKRELALWTENRGVKWGTVQGFIFANRYQFLGKLPSELSDLELLRGISISGLLRGWTVFDNAGMKAVVDQYNPSSIYDPCAGWGERLATAAALEIAYTGTDINPAVVEGHARIAEQYGLSSQSTVLGDAAGTDRRDGDHEMVFTCPPYGSVEIYTESGAENLDPEGFQAWWRSVVEMSIGSETKVFAYQINQKLKTVMNAALVARGWRLDAQIPVGKGRASHFNRSAGTSSKREYEEVQVFVR